MTHHESPSHGCADAKPDNGKQRDNAPQPSLIVEITVTRRRFIAVLLGAGLLTLPITGMGLPGLSTRKLTLLMDRLAPAIETLTERTTPTDWALLHACLYYALAGQYILARHGIGTHLKGGAVLYFPATPRHHAIRPHVWLETGSHFIDCSALLRWGYIAVIPLSRVARYRAAVIPGITRVLILEERNDIEFRDYVAEHRTRFERAMLEKIPNHE